ncbi:LysR substrate-binding domain-containing protein [Acuticoccus sp. I52.16.1]|uniref:LysR substrate-binding domain-containing protein n=1 Tax=Acuticoccus sp. I52.16.1 TaxID=2928472 RepID=UPI001FD2CC7F|nr:LysR substrate-binding domain-containing protein [Acuticoccus sp. I52.16.1]UOM35187.1 LysR substrate-binding domain-containing protein [Acuticoccus sp. I52.16.1]
MTLDQVRIFLAVAERRHVTRAAEALHLTQSAVSSAIAALEAQHGVALFDRVGRGIAPTEAGEIFIDAARSLLAQAETTRLVLDDLAREMRGRLRIAASQTVASYWLPGHLMALHDRHPKIQIALSVGNTAHAARAVREGAADLGFVEGEVPADDLHREVVARDELVMVLARGHGETRRPAFTAGDYRALRWVLREPGSGTRSAAEAHFAVMGLTAADLDVALELPSNEAVLAAVGAGDAVTILSRRAVGAFRTRRIAMRRVTWAPRPVRPFAVLTHPQRHKTRAAQALLALVTAELGA